MTVVAAANVTQEMFPFLEQAVAAATCPGDSRLIYFGFDFSKH